MRLRLALLFSAALLGVGPVHGAERVTLKNGFDMVCHHREFNGSRTRLYTTETSFVEVGTDQIAAIEQLPDPPPEQKQRESQPSPEAASIPELTSRAGKRHNVDVDLLASIIRAESGGNPRAMSRVGAAGLMQLMPSTAQELGVQDRFHPEQNINGGTAYIDALLTRYHDDLPLALAAYNAGPAAVDKYHGIPPYRETRAYVARVIREFNRRVTAREATNHSVQTPPNLAKLASPPEQANEKP